MSRNIDRRLVCPEILECPARCERIQNVRRHGRQGDIHAPHSLHRCRLIIRYAPAAVAVHDAEPVVERNQIGDRSFFSDAWVVRAPLAYRRGGCRFLRRDWLVAERRAWLKARVTSGGGSPWRPRIG